jgi:hypothetical protein
MSARDEDVWPVVVAEVGVVRVEGDLKIFVRIADHGGHEVPFALDPDGAEDMAVRVIEALEDLQKLRVRAPPEMN